MSSRRQNTNLASYQQNSAFSGPSPKSTLQQNPNTQYQQLLVPGGASQPMSHQTPGSGMFPPIENLQQFRQQLMMSLAKFSDTQTCKQAQDEIKELMTEHITNTDRMNAFLLMLQEHNEHMRPNHRKELIRLYGAAAEIFEEALIPFMPKILAYLQRKLKENDSLLHGVISESLGALVHQVLKKTESLDELLEQFNPILKLLFNNLQTPNRQLQIGSAISLTRVIQNAPVLVLQTTLPTIAQKVLEILTMNICKCQTQLLESLISLILAVENDFSKYCEQFLPTLLECMTNNDWQVRKMAIDVIYTMAAILREAIAPYKQEILECLSHSRSDKNKPVREATLEAMQAIKDIPSGQTPEPHQQYQQQQKQEQSVQPQKSQQSFKRPPSSKPQVESNKNLRQYARELSPQVSLDSLAQNSKQQNNMSTTSLPKPKIESQRTNQRDLHQNKSHTSRSQTRTATGAVNNSQANTGTNRSRYTHNDVDASKSDNDNTQIMRKTLTSATQKKIARQNEASMPTTQSKILSAPKESIFKGPRNPGFFSRSDDIEILEGQKPQSQYEDDEDNDYQSLEQDAENNRQDDMSIKIYEGKKPAYYQDNQRKESQYMQSTKKQNHNQISPNQMNSSHKKISPIKKSFLEQNDLQSERKINYNLEENLNGYSPTQNDKSYLSSSQMNQQKYQQPKQAWQKQSPQQISQQNQQPLHLSNGKQESFVNQNDFMNFNHPTQQNNQQIPAYLLMSQPPQSNFRQAQIDQSQLPSNQLQYNLDQQQLQQQQQQLQQNHQLSSQPTILTLQQQPLQIQSPPPPTIIQSNDQQIQFLIQELQKMHTTQTLMMERMNDYQNQQKNDIFSLQARIAKLEDIINIQNQQNQILKQQVLNTTSSPQQYQTVGFTQQYQQNALTQAVSNPNLSQSFTLSNDNTQAMPNTKYDGGANGAVNRGKWNQQQHNTQTVNNPNQTGLNKNTLWQQIQDLLTNQQLNEAYQLLLKNDLETLQSISQDDRDLLLIKLIGKTGVCLERLDTYTLDCLLNRIISILSQREFIDVLLPWLSQITNYLIHHQGANNASDNKMDLNTSSNLIECLLLLLSDTTDQGGSLNTQQRSEIEQIYLSMNKQMKVNKA